MNDDVFEGIEHVRAEETKAVITYLQLIIDELNSGKTENILFREFHSPIEMRFVPLQEKRKTCRSRKTIMIKFDETF